MGFRCLVLAVILLLTSVATRMEAKQVFVGNQMGWTNYDLHSFRVPNYGAWATSQCVRVGDQVVFRYGRGRHNVYLLPNREAFLSCDFSRARLLDPGVTGLYIWKATASGMFYFGCNRKVEEEGNHCGSGQKLALLVRPEESHTSPVTIDELSIFQNQDAATPLTLLSPTNNATSPAPSPTEAPAAPNMTSAATSRFSSQQNFQTWLLPASGMLSSWVLVVMSP